MNNFMPFEALLLGLSSGTYCAVACAPVALPFLFSRGPTEKPLRANAALLTLFLAGRLLAYVTVGALLGAAGAYAARYVDPSLARILSRIAYGLAGALMIAAGLIEGFPKARPCKAAARAWRPGVGAFFFGVLTGASICPPFFAAASRVFSGAVPGTPGSGTLAGAVYFAFFFIGTSLWLVPLFGLPLVIRKTGVLAFMARCVMTMLGAYFLLVVGLLGAT